MYNLVKPISTRKELLQRKIRIFTYQEFVRIFKLSSHQAEYNLRQLTQEGLLSRLKQGLYVLKTDPPDEEEIANALYKPSYISFEYALAYYNLLPEMTYQISCATTKPTRLFTVDNTAFVYYTIKVEAYTGYVLVSRGDRQFLIAEPEKAFVDYLYFVALGQRTSYNERIKTDPLHKEKVFQYAGLYQRDKLNELIEKIL